MATFSSAVAKVETYISSLKATETAIPHPTHMLNVYDIIRNIIDLKDPQLMKMIFDANKDLEKLYKAKTVRVHPFYTRAFIQGQSGSPKDMPRCVLKYAISTADPLIMYCVGIPKPDIMSLMTKIHFNGGEVMMDEQYINNYIESSTVVSIIAALKRDIDLINVGVNDAKFTFKPRTGSISDDKKRLSIESFCKKLDITFREWNIRPPADMRDSKEKTPATALFDLLQAKHALMLTALPTATKAKLTSDEWNEVGKFITFSGIMDVCLMTGSVGNVFYKIGYKPAGLTTIRASGITNLLNNTFKNKSKKIVKVNELSKDHPFYVIEADKNVKYTEILSTLRATPWKTSVTTDDNLIENKIVRNVVSPFTNEDRDKFIVRLELKKKTTFVKRVVKDNKTEFVTLPEDDQKMINAKIDTALGVIRAMGTNTMEELITFGINIESEAGVSFSYTAPESKPSDQITENSDDFTRFQANMDKLPKVESDGLHILTAFGKFDMSKVKILVSGMSADPHALDDGGVSYFYQAAQFIKANGAKEATYNKLMETYINLK